MNMLMAFCCCWPYEAPLPDDGIRMPILTSAIANELPVKSKAITADPVFQFLNMTFSPAAASLKGADGMHRGYCFGINVVNCEIQPVARRGVLTSLHEDQTCRLTTRSSPLTSRSGAFASPKVRCHANSSKVCRSAAV